MAREPKKTETTLVKLRIKRSSLATGREVLQLLAVLGVLFGILGAFAGGQLWLCWQDFPDATVQECFSGAARAKGKSR